MPFSYILMRFQFYLYLSYVCLRAAVGFFYPENCSKFIPLVVLEPCFWFPSGRSESEQDAHYIDQPQTRLGWEGSFENGTSSIGTRTHRRLNELVTKQRHYGHNSRLHYFLPLYNELSYPSKLDVTLYFRSHLIPDSIPSTAGHLNFCAFRS